MRFAAVMMMLTLVVSPVAAEEKVEEGYTALFNGKNLDGWKVRGGAALEGMTESPKGRVKVQDGALFIDGSVKGGQLLDSTVEFGPKSSVKFQYLAGKGCNNDLFYLGLKFDIKLNNQTIKNMKEGEWNDFEIVGNGETIEFRNNGEVQYSAKPKAQASPLGLRAEFGDIHYRNMRYKK